MKKTHLGFSIPDSPNGSTRPFSKTCKGPNRSTSRNGGADIRCRSCSRPHRGFWISSRKGDPASSGFQPDAETPRRGEKPRSVLVFLSSCLHFLLAFFATLRLSVETANLVFNLDRVTR